MKKIPNSSDCLLTPSSLLNIKTVLTEVNLLNGYEANKLRCKCDGLRHEPKKDDLELGLQMALTRMTIDDNE